MFQLITLFLRYSVEDFPKFSVNLDEVALSHRLIELSIVCVQSFVHSPSFTQSYIFSDHDLGLLTSAVTAAGTFREESSYEANVLPEVIEPLLLISRGHTMLLL